MLLHVTIALVGVATLNLALPAPLNKIALVTDSEIDSSAGARSYVKYPNGLDRLGLIPKWSKYPNGLQQTYTIY